MPKKNQFQVSPERYQVVSADIKLGSEPGPRFYIMVAVSSLIACFGLIANSTAVVIGAMLVAPLMTPIFGIALALVQGNTKLLGRAIRAEVAGVVFAITMALILGKVHPVLEVTPEMLVRTQPNLLDLLVAILAGFAGAYAMVDEHISPALPGVAIATAIVPPLANTGLCIALGAYEGALGSFLLFFANFLSILLVASATFIAAGMTSDIRALTKKDLIGRFGLAAICFLALAGFLSNALVDMIKSRHLEITIESLISDEIANFPATGMDKMIHEFHDGKIYVMASVHTPNVFTPVEVKKIQDRLTQKLKTPTELIIRSKLSNDVSATGSTSRVVAQNLDGFFLSKKTNPNVEKIRISEQTIREYLSTQIGLHLYEVDLLKFEKKLIILANIGGIRKISLEEIKKLETMIHERTGDANIGLVIRMIQMDFYESQGIIRYEWFKPSGLTPDQQSLYDRVSTFLQEQFNHDDEFSLKHLSSAFIDDSLHMLLEVVGMRVFLQNDLIKLEKLLDKTFEKPIKLYVWSKPEIVVSSDGYDSYDNTSKNIYEMRKVSIRMDMEKILDAAD